MTDHLEACTTLRKFLKPGSAVYPVLRHRNSMGTTRWFSLLIIAKDFDGKPEIRDIAYLTAVVCGLRYDLKREALRVNGGGMDMGFYCVYSLGRALWPKGFKLPKGTLGRNGDTSGFDTDGGYALQHYRI